MRPTTARLLVVVALSPLAVSATVTSSPPPPSPFAPAPADEYWGGTLECDLKVKIGIGPRDRRPNGPQVADAVQVALASAVPTPYPLGNGLSIAGPVKSVSGSRFIETGYNTDFFTITVVAFGPLLQPISKVVRNLDFINAVREALANAGRTSIYQKENAPILAAMFAAEKMGSPYTAADFTVTAVQNVDGTWSVSVEVDAPDNAADAQSAAKKLSATTPEGVELLETALRSGSGSVKSVAPATVAADTISWSFVVELAAPLEVVGEDKFNFTLQDALSPSPPPGNLGGLDEAGGSAITDKAAESLGAGIIFAIILFLLCFLTPLSCFCFVRGRYGVGKEQLYFKLKLSHSNPTFPALYIPYEDREKMRAELHTKKPAPEKQDTSVLDDDMHI